MALLPVDEAKARILDGARPLGIEQVPLADALGRVLARSLRAKRDQPPFNASAMDGYALSAADAAAVPATLKLVGSAPAGRAFSRRVRRGETVRIFTGAPLPKGTDSIAIQENAEQQGDDVIIRVAPIPGKHIRRRGLDYSKGEILLNAPQRLGPRAIGLAAAMNNAALPVRRKPRVGLLATGNELVAPGGKPAANQIVTSNTAALTSLVRVWGGEAFDLGIARDLLKETRAAIGRGKAADVLVTTGGASVGEHDLVRQALKAQGFRIGFWKIAMRPGKPLMFASKGRQRVLGLPGNPVSAIVCARLFLKPLMDTLLGFDEPERLISARLGAPLGPNDERQDYLRATLSRDQAGLAIATPFKVQDSSMQLLLAEADCLIVRPPFQGALDAGHSVDVLLLDF